MSKPPNILVFDSGAGGLSVASAILKKTPYCKLTYAADIAGFPYGLMNDEMLVSRVRSQVSCLIDKVNPDIIVIACNTASTIALKSLRDEFHVPFVGVVPAIKPAAALSKTGVIGILATPATVNREYTNNLIDQFAKKTIVKLYGSNTLVKLAEGLITGTVPDQKLIDKELENLFSQRSGNAIDTIVLACTHFPLLISYLQEGTKNRVPNITWIDSNAAIARRVAYLINELKLKENFLLEQGFKYHINFMVSGEVDVSTRTEKSYRAYLDNI